MVYDVRPDLEEWLDELNAEPQEWSGNLIGKPCTIRNESGGFGLPHLLVTFHNLPLRGRLELALIESENYVQDGSEPLQADGWAWRLICDSDESMLSGGWSDCVATAAEALAEGIRALAEENEDEEDE
jgi:hypothetical protein